MVILFSCVSMASFIGRLCSEHTLMYSGTGAHRQKCVWLVSKLESGSIWRIIPRPPVSLCLPSRFCSLPFVPSHGLIWGRTQFLISTPWVLLIRAPLAAVGPHRGHRVATEWHKIKFLETMRSICRVKPDEGAIFSQLLFHPQAPCSTLLAADEWKPIKKKKQQKLGGKN